MIKSALTEAIDLASKRLYQDEKPHRNHLGGSVIGNDCGRAIAFTFKWVKREDFDGRMLRLFQRGHREEEALKELLVEAGVKFHQPDKQHRVSACDGHLGGSLDAVGRYVPGENRDEWFLFEFKTYNSSRFKQLVKNGVIISNFNHFCQMQIYMYLANLQAGYYIAVCKDTDEIHIERIGLQPDQAKQLVLKAERIINGDPPAPISSNPAFYKCKMCSFHEVCYGKKDLVERNCRTCEHAKPVENGKWACHYGRDEIEDQRGCEHWFQSPLTLPQLSLIEMRIDDSDPHECVALYYDQQGETITVAPGR